MLVYMRCLFIDWLADMLCTALLFVVENATSLKDAAAYFHTHKHIDTYTLTHILRL